MNLGNLPYGSVGVLNTQLSNQGQCNAIEPKIGMEITRAHDRLFQMLQMAQGCADDLGGHQPETGQAPGKIESQSVKSMMAALHLVVTQLENQIHRIRAAV